MTREKLPAIFTECKIEEMTRKKLPAIFAGRIQHQQKQISLLLIKYILLLYSSSRLTFKRLNKFNKYTNFLL